MYAVIETGGKQYRVTEQTRLRVEKLDAAFGEEVRLDRVLLLSDDSGVRIGRPYVEGAVVTARVVGRTKVATKPAENAGEDAEPEYLPWVRGPKINGFTYKPKKNYHRRYGHRQRLTELLIQKIEGGSAGRQPAVAAEPAAQAVTEE